MIDAGGQMAGVAAWFPTLESETRHRLQPAAQGVPLVSADDEVAAPWASLGLRATGQAGTAAVWRPPVAASVAWPAASTLRPAQP
jgi:hypothetical protein